MWVLEVKISNLRGIRRLHWLANSTAPGWHVIIGDNGSGKTTFLRAVALAILGAPEASALRQDWLRWIPSDKTSSEVRVLAIGERDYDIADGEPVGVFGFHLLRSAITGPGIQPMPSAVPSSSLYNSILGSQREPENGWFSVGYGPFRRFSGGDNEREAMLTSNPRLGAHLSLFGEDVDLRESLSWLQELKFKELEQKPVGRLLEQIREFLNRGALLPALVQLDEVSSEGIIFIDGNGCRVLVQDLSDGYRSILCIAFDLIRQMVRFYGPNRVFDPTDPTRVAAPGVVLIDEVDAHLHPTWQQDIGHWLTAHFPNVQFIVTTHSPLVCQAAERGSVFRLPRPGTDEVGEMVSGRDLERLLYGNVLDAYGTDLFGESVEQSDTGRKRLERLAQLNVKELRQGLTDEERLEQEALRGAQPSTSGILAVADREAGE